VSRAAHVPTFAPGGAPVSFLVDYDGTVSLADVANALLGRFFPDPSLATMDAAYDAGTIGSRDLTRWDMDVLPDDPALLREAAAALPQDETFPGFVEAVLGAGAAVEVVSDGLGFYVEPNLVRLDPRLGALPVATNENPIAGGTAVTWPYGHPACFVCGTCKRERVRAHQAAGRAVVFVGDGTSDRYAAHHADVVFAKDSLLAWGRATGRAFIEWDRFAEIEAWFRDALRDGTLPATPADGPPWRATQRPLRLDFICGPEAWGPGRTVPRPPSTGPHSGAAGPALGGGGAQAVRRAGTPRRRR